MSNGRINTTCQFIKSFLYKKECIFLWNMEPLRILRAFRVMQNASLRSLLFLIRTFQYVQLYSVRVGTKPI